MTIQRRDLLIGCGALLGSTALARTAFSRPLTARREAAPPRLILVELKGGNDGLNTVVPHADDAYYRARPKLGLRGEEVLRIDDRVGLHSALGRLHRRALDGQLGIVHGVGYPDPNLSHFKSTDVWHAARSDGRSAGRGWIGRLAEARHADAAHPDRLIHVGSSLPFAMYSPKHPAVAFSAPVDYRFAKHGDDLDMLSAEGARAGSRLEFLRKVMHDAQMSSAAVRRAVADHRPVADFPATPLGSSLRIVAALASSDVECEVVSVEHGGFDTHNDQPRRHEQVLGQLDEALDALLVELAAQPAAARTLVLVTSEFGRRVAENGSRGTDHGTAAPVLFAGPAARCAQLGEQPDLERLDARGNLLFTVDFRRVLAAVVSDLFAADTRDVLGDSYRPLPLLS